MTRIGTIGHYIFIQSRQFVHYSVFRLPYVLSNFK